MVSTHGPGGCACFSHVTDAPGSRGAIPARIVCTVCVGCRIWGLAVPVTGEVPDGGSAGSAYATRGRHARSPAVTRWVLARPT